MVTRRRGSIPSSQLRHESAGTPHSRAACATLVHFMRCLISASRAPNVESSGTHDELVAVSAVLCVMGTQ